ncbi:alpha-glucuronidase family glycosyl hydrolase [Arenibacter sp. GZD96]|uniref:alpha-glucuronidase family glycosyl hydrolase n=1 Tax=Aurantibrevibacter litoralis TaxID=3106030 RepID=UPI002AFFEDA3|nr:alpha-glucuronidase family glycosyl hydrolase [Arenibacter sp. GZD-96]MEA1786964.1 alpha-glucuronidase family glycosyl hydrolase [Arenibacter sp. GZD-96]
MVVKLNFLRRYLKAYTLISILFLAYNVKAENGYDLWLRYHPIEDSALRERYKDLITDISIKGESETLRIVREEIRKGLSGLLDGSYTTSGTFNVDASLLIAKKNDLTTPLRKDNDRKLSELKNDGFFIYSRQTKTGTQLIITANNDIGLLYGVFHFLRLLQQHKALENLAILENPKINLRLLNHWDNLDRTVERGYAGFSIWNWHTLPDYIDQRYMDYARANASIGINGTVLTNVNANALILTPSYLQKVKALADLFRPYGIKVYLTARFSAPIEIGGLATADPLDLEVKEWWTKIAKEIYTSIPDFGGFVVKANSEGQPGPQNYGRNHVDGANMLADALLPFKGVVMWRAFVYSEHDPTDRAKQAYSEFVPFDGSFRENVIIQVKNGAIDFQPREPFHPMFGAMPKTPLMMEFQITQEYLGFSTHLVFLPKLFEEVLDADTYQKGKGATVAKVIDGSLHNTKLSGIAGVANIGNDINWTGHIFAQANWYGYGRLAWSPELSADVIADEWLKATFTNEDDFIVPMKNILLESREMVVNYMNPLGLHHIFDTGHHYGPGPWVGNLSRPEWNPTYYHKADSMGIGFDRTASGSNAVSQYAPEVAQLFSNVDSCPEEYLLWFHHLPWNYTLKNGETLWNGMALKYQEGVNQVRDLQHTWERMKPYVDSERFASVTQLIAIQLKEAIWWKNACMLYFQEFSKQDFPKEMEKPDATLDYYKSLQFPFAPGIRPRWD